MWVWRAPLLTQDQVTCYYSSIHPSTLPLFFFCFFIFLFCFSFCTRAFAKSSSVAITSQYSRMSQKRVERPRTAEPVGRQREGSEGTNRGRWWEEGVCLSVTWPILTVVLPNGTTIVCSSPIRPIQAHTYTLLCVSYLVFAFHALCVRPCVPCCPSLPTSREPFPFLLTWHWLGLPLLSERPRAFQSGLECAGTLWSGARALNFHWIPGELREKEEASRWAHTSKCQ